MTHFHPNFLNRTQALRLLLLLGVAAAAMIAPESLAGKGGTEFSTLHAQLTGWIQGGLGRTIALAAVVIGAIFSVARSNPLPILSGIAFAIFQQYSPAIVSGILTGLL